MTNHGLASRTLITTFVLTLAGTVAGCDKDGDLGKDSDVDSASGSASDSGGTRGDSDSDSSGSQGSGSDSGSSDTASSDTSVDSDTGDTGVVPCDETICGPAPGAPDVQCDDGSTAGWICADAGQGCGWIMESCPDDEPCTEDECGDPPGAPNQLCPDGVNYSGPGACERNADGTCGYPWLECPACCDPTTLPDCPEPITCCADGSWVCGDATACDDGATALPCDAGGQCVQEQGSCAAGEMCCAGLTCCAGNPVPVGEEYCGSECPISDRNAKENFATVDVDEVLARVRALEISTWNYKTSPDAIRHVGPMAQDFKAAFAVGETDRAIFPVDADGVALASVQALDRQVAALETENEALRATLAAVQARLDALEAQK